MTSKFYTFYRANNDFADILSDTNIKKVIDTKISWWQHLMIGIEETKNSGTFSYITLKYGEEMIGNIVKDHTPIPGVDYIPKKDIASFGPKDQ
jgi:hypothetical protein